MYYIGLITTEKSEVMAEGYRRVMYTNTPMITFPIALYDWGTIDAMGIAESEYGEFLKIVEFNLKKFVCNNDTFTIAQDSLARSFNEYIKIESVPAVQLKKELFPGGFWSGGGEVHCSGVISDFGRRFIWGGFSGKVRDYDKYFAPKSWD